MNVSDVEYTAGLGGFLVLFGLGLVLWFLGRDLSRRLRGLRQREAVRLREASHGQTASHDHGQPAPGPGDDVEDGRAEATPDEEPEAPTQSRE